ncbi:MAG: ATP-binding cassette domain-containing protein [Clostridia bacterium]|nr:ATP-binding cassette domain-containing protein [Clostridia bacterium]
MLQLKNITYIPEGDKDANPVLQDINLTLERNRFYVITGPNGGGKSSLAKIIMGIYQPTSGKIFFEGQDITELSITERASLGIGYAFQQPPRFKGITVEELLRLSTRKNGQSSDGNGAGCNFLYDVGLCPKDYEQREVNASLSGGELKRIEIASLLSRNCRLAIFDEPEAGIDLWSFSRLTEIFTNLKKKDGTCTVIISHQERILALADEVIVLAEGQVKEKGDKEDLLDGIINRCDCRKDCVERA